MWLMGFQKLLLCQSLRRVFSAWKSWKPSVLAHNLSSSRMLSGEMVSFAHGLEAAGVPQKQHPCLWHLNMWPPERSLSLPDEDETLQVWDEEFEKGCNLNFLVRFLFLYFWLDFESEWEIQRCCCMSTSILWWLLNLMTGVNQICELTEGSNILGNLHVPR